MKFSRLLSALSPYVAGEQPKDKKYIKLNTNENAYPPSPKIAEALKDIDIAELRRYPDPEALELRAAIARLHGVAPENVFAGNGSDEVLGFCFPAFFDPKGCDPKNPTPPILFPDVTYSFYPVYAELYRIPYQNPPLCPDYTLDPSDYKGVKNQGIIIANPNAPTGIALAAREIEGIAAANPDTLVLIDEAYGDFGRESVIPLTLRYKNLLVVRTFSKSYALAGIRCGYAIGDAALIAAINVVKNSFNSYPLDKITQKIAVASCQDPLYYDMINTRIIKTRDNAAKLLREHGFTVLDSASNFLFIKKDGLCGETLFLRLRETGVLTRHFKGERTQSFIRVTIGTELETESLINALIKISETQGV